MGEREYVYSLKLNCSFVCRKLSELNIDYSSDKNYNYDQFKNSADISNNINNLIAKNRIEATSVIEKVNHFQEQEKLLRSNVLMSNLEKLHEWISNNIHEVCHKKIIN